jgi:hypothetical protein
MIISMAELRRAALRRPPGYLDAVMAVARSDGPDLLTITQSDYLLLCQRYRGNSPEIEPPPEPRLSDLLTDYHRALQPWIEQGAAVLLPEEMIARLEACRRCPAGLWTEDLADGYGRCEDLQRPCSKLRLWSPQVSCMLPAAQRQW